MPPVLAIAIAAKERKDDVKLGQALHKLRRGGSRRCIVVHNPETARDRAVGPGRDAPARRDRAARRALRRRHRRPARPPVGYQRDDHASRSQLRGRHKKQSGGHGQFGDVVLDIKPLPRGAGFEFEDKITGGVVPRNYIPSVEEGVSDALKHGPLGFPVVDVAVTLIDGSYHTVDSSDMAFRTAGAHRHRRRRCRNASRCCWSRSMLVEIACPTEATAKINAIVSGRRGQILGFDTREGWAGWDVVRGA